jgi:hypothetical protein
VAVMVGGRRVRGVVVAHRSEDATADATIDYGDVWFVEYDDDQEPDPGVGGFHDRADMEFIG